MTDGNSSGLDLDIYGDVESDDFKQEVEAEPNNDLYDDVITNSKSDSNDEPVVQSPKETSQPTGSVSGTSSQPYTRRYQVYVGNLTWWTTDQEIEDAVRDVGVTDLIEVKFHENRQNGQSKGFCCVAASSEGSMKAMLDKLPLKELHGQKLEVTHTTKQALIQFESQSKTRPPQQPPQQHPPPRSLMGNAGRIGMGMAMPRHPGVPSIGFTRPPPGLPARVSLGLMPPRGPPPLMSAPPPTIPLHAPPVAVSLAPAGPIPHVNPAFFPHAAPPPAGFPPLVTTSVQHNLSEAEFEDIMSRNRTVSSSAIARAVQDAANGEFASAIETLVTAISLIRQSKVAQDDRCKILISSLQDTLHGIETKSYSQRRDRSRSPRHRSSAGRERDYYREHYHRSSEYRHYDDYRDRERRDHYRDREHRERDRDYYRGREDRYYDERKRYEDRDRIRVEDDHRGESSSRGSRGHEGDHGERERRSSERRRE